MESKTPQFDALLDEILENLVPYERVCKWKGEHPHCEGEFEITGEDIKFLKMLRVPPPNFCPTCRRIKRFANMNLSRLFKRPCNIMGHTEDIISILPAECPFPVVEYTHFISDDFDASSFGRDFKEGESPMQQLMEMRINFPMPSFLNRDPSCINSEYSNGGRDLKNGYYCFGSYTSENIWYTSMVSESKDVMDSRIIKNSDHVYRSVLSNHIYKSSFIYFSTNCTDSMFLFDCKNCDSCFGCVNLRNARYHVWNKKLSQADYEAFMASIMPFKASDFKKYERELWDLVKSLPLNASRNAASENVEGVLCRNSKNCYNVTDVPNSDNVRHSDGVFNHTSSMDILFSGGHSSNLYSIANVGSQASNIKFSMMSKFSSDSEFIFNCKNVHNCFMCFGLQNKSYCVFNRQYSSDEYYALVDKIKTDMWKRDEYGDGLGMEFSPQAYNFSLGQIAFLLSDEQIVKLGGYVAKEPESNVGNTKILEVGEVPETIEQVPEDIINCALRCEISGKPFRITKSELAFYKKMKLPLPTTHPAVRLENNLRLAPLGVMYQATCAKCHKPIDSLFDPKENFILYCEECFKKEVY